MRLFWIPETTIVTSLMMVRTRLAAKALQRFHGAHRYVRNVFHIEIGSGVNGVEQCPFVVEPSAFRPSAITK